MRRSVIIAVLFHFHAIFTLCTPTFIHASAGVLYKNRASLPLFEKVGKTENLLDNPARLASIGLITLDNFTNISIQDSQTSGSIYRDTAQSDSLEYSSQVVYPFIPWAVANLGYGYDHAFDLFNTLNQNDGSTLNSSEDKDFNRAFNAGVATKALVTDYCFGYAVRRNESSNFLDVHRNGQLSTDSYLNVESDFQHTAGIVLNGNLEVYGSYATEKFQASYGQVQEVDLSLDHTAVNARYVLGTPDQENWVIFGNFTQTNLRQNQLDVARIQYLMDFPVYHAEANAYYYLPRDDLEMAVGAELSYDERNGLDSALQPRNYDIYQAKIPCLLSGRFLPFLQVWSEVDLLYVRNTGEASHSFRLQQAYGIKITFAPVEINLYSNPFVNWFKSENASDTQAAALGLDLMARF